MGSVLPKVVTKYIF